MILDKINNPDDLKSCDISQLNTLADEIRQILITRVTKTGGHMGSNLGMVEPTIALHYVFNSPYDKIVFDVSHQSYTHKILTGRKEGFTDPDKYNTLSGYTTPNESKHDCFKVGHTSTSVSLAAGLAKARDLKGGDENIIAVIGDGSMSGGEAFEGLNNASALNSNIIVLFNDNGMSIAENSGGLYSNFKLLRDTKGKADNNYFKAFGFEYYFVEQGNDLAVLIDMLKKVKGTDKPTVIHMCTLKGKGLDAAVNDKEAGHWFLPGDTDFEALAKTPDYGSITADYLLDKMKRDSSVITISAATPGATGLSKEFRQKAGRQFVDVGIAEEHAVAFSSALARGDAKPVYEVLSSFLQRTYDQLSQDLAMNNNPATVLVFGGGISGGDCTHNGMYDVSLIGSIPNLVCLAPTAAEEYLAMLDWSIDQTEHPVIIRVPDAAVHSGKNAAFTTADVYKSIITEQGKGVALLGLGSGYTLACGVKNILSQQGIDATLVNPVNYSQLDTATLDMLKKEHSLAVTIEYGVLDGGYGQKVASYYGTSDIKVLNYGAQKDFNDLMPLDKVLGKSRLTKEQIADDILAIINHD